MIHVDQLRYRYPGTEQETLRGISFAIAPGEIFGFLGPSGSGKSTTQKILYKLLSGYTGAVRIKDRALPQWDRDFYRTVGVGFELPNHYLKLTALENLRFFASFYARRYASLPELLALVGLENDADKRVSSFSKGMKMRLNFIRSFMHDPDILFLDEPAAGLDPVNARVVKDIILKLRAEGKTIFITTHSMFDADALCDRVALIINGEIKALDTPAALKLRYGQHRVRVQLTGQNDAQEFPLDQLGHNDAFLSLIHDNEVETIHSEEATLEDVFIQVTGQSLHQAVQPVQP
ncbi:MAG: ABC transporter ATP-binding protein [Tunicatimonas sp.]